MLFSISTTVRPLTALLFAAMGVACLWLKEREAAMLLFGSATTQMTLAQKPEKRTTSP